MKNLKQNLKTLAQKLKELIKFFTLSILFFSNHSSLIGDEIVKSSVKSAVDKINSKLPLVRTNPTDIALQPFWQCPHTLKKVNALLLDPVRAPIDLDRWNQIILNGTTPIEMSKIAEEIFDEPQAKLLKKSKDRPIDLSAIRDANLRNSVRKFCFAIRTAKTLAADSFRNLNAGERNHILSLYQIPMSSGTPSLQNNKFMIETYRSLEKFKLGRMLEANAVILKMIEQERGHLQKWAFDSQSSKKMFNRINIKTDLGTIILSGAGDDDYSEKELEECSLLIDAGGNNRYIGSVAGAKQGEIRIAMDWGENVVVISTQNYGGAGSGVFGIGYLFMPNPRGRKSILTGSYSQGFGLCGFGGLFVNGKGEFKGNHYSQGVGIFGAGIFSNSSGEYSSYTASLYGQGVGLTKGIGIFRHIGSHSIFKAGLIDPDPREPLGMTSLCQGVGYGPRGFAAGGIGFCILNGDQLSLESSYFAQGAGYWRAAGSFMIKGNNNIVKARRYDQGSGIHNALGFFNLIGSQSQIVNWGVGPAFGWDGGTGWAIIDGNENQVQAEWGACAASINNSRSFSVFMGDENKLDLPGLASAQISRDIPDYAVSWIEGKNNALKIPGLKTDKSASGTLYRSPWGILHLSSATFSSSLNLPKAEWTALPHAPAANPINLEEEIKKSFELPQQEKIEKLIQIASAFGSDKSQSKKALVLLLNADPSERIHIIRAIAPENLEEFLQIRIVISILGDLIASDILDELKNERDPQRKSWLLSSLPLLKAQNVFPTVMESIGNYNWKIQTVGLRVAGHLFNNDPIQPGKLYMLKEIENWLRSKIGWRFQTKEISKHFSRICVSVSHALLPTTQKAVILSVSSLPTTTTCSTPAICSICRSISANWTR